MEKLPIPPPPLPLLSVKKSFSAHVQLVSTRDSDYIVIKEVLERWIEQQSGNFLVFWQKSSTILQQGPQYFALKALYYLSLLFNSYFIYIIRCGLVALTMAAQSFGISIDTQSVFELAFNMGISKCGEMFSSSALSTLANKIQVKSILLDDGFCDVLILLRYLFSGKMLLVP